MMMWFGSVKNIMRTDHQDSQADQEDQQGRGVRFLQASPEIKQFSCDEVRKFWTSCSSADSPTHRLSFGSQGSVRPGQTSVPFLSLLSWGSNKTDKTRVSLLSLGSGVSTQTGQTRGSLQKKKKMRRRTEEEPRETMREKVLVVPEVQEVLSVLLDLEILVHPETQKQTQQRFTIKLGSGLSNILLTTDPGSPRSPSVPVFPGVP